MTDVSGATTAAKLQARPVAWFVVAAVTGFWLYRLCWPVIPPDFADFLFPWYDHILSAGRIQAFARPFSDYTPSYLYLLAAASLAHPLLGTVGVIKSLSVAGTAFLAFSLATLVRTMGGDPRRGLLIFVVPSIALNAALLGQCDAIWAGACVLAVAAAIRTENLQAAIWSGVAISFKAQAAFIAPFILGVLWGRRAPWWCWMVPPAIYAAFMLPAWIMGWPAADLATVYLHQAAKYPSPGNLANPWILLTMLTGRVESPLFVLGDCAALAAAAGIALLTARTIDRPRALLMLALLSSLALPFLLPKMHERYYFLADALAIAALLAAPSPRTWGIAGAVQVASLASILTYVYFFSTAQPAVLAAAMGMILATIVAAIGLAAISQEAIREGAISLQLAKLRAGLIRL